MRISHPDYFALQRFMLEVADVLDRSLASQFN